MHSHKGIMAVSTNLTPLPRLHLNSPPPVVPHGQSRVYPLVLQIRQEGVLDLLISRGRNTTGVHDKQPQSLHRVSLSLRREPLWKMTYVRHEFGVFQHDGA
jgi:hypothetical protein